LLYTSRDIEIGNISIYISGYRERVIHPLFAILEILPTYSPYNAVVGVVLSQKWKKYLLPIVSENVLGHRGPLGHSRNSGEILFHFCRTTPPTALEQGNTFSMTRPDPLNVHCASIRTKIDITFYDAHMPLKENGELNF
jgi:hypothetical protein